VVCALSDQPSSYAVILRSGGETYGAIVLDSKSYLIQSLVDGYSLLLEEDMSHFPTEGCALIRKAEKSVKNPLPNSKDAADCDPQTTVRISVFYTASAAAQQANMSQYVGTQVAKTKIELRSRSGAKLISSVEKVQDSGKHFLRIEDDLNPGIYFLHIQTDNANAI
jgi:hypothetical protein